MVKQKFVVMDGQLWIAEPVKMDDGSTALVAQCRADWRWRSAQTNDVWRPKPRKVGREIKYQDAFGRTRTMECQNLSITQHHAADKTAMVRTENGERRMIKWASLKRHWIPSTVRKLPARYEG